MFEGEWHQNAFLSQPEIGKALRRRAPINAGAMFELVNGYTEQLLRVQKQYAEWTGLPLLKSTVEQLEARLSAIREARRGCVLPLGWGAGFLSKVAILNTQDETYRGILRQVGLYARAIQSGCRSRRRGASCSWAISLRVCRALCIWKWQARRRVQINGFTARTVP